MYIEHFFYKKLIFLRTEYGNNFLNILCKMEQSKQTSLDIISYRTLFN